MAGTAGDREVYFQSPDQDTGLGGDMGRCSSGLLGLQLADILS